MEKTPSFVILARKREELAWISEKVAACACREGRTVLSFLSWPARRPHS